MMSGRAARDSVQLLREEFGAELRRLRQAANLTQDALARRVGYHRVSITQVEKGRQACGREFVEQVEAALDGQGQLLAIYQRLDAERNQQPAAQASFDSGSALAEEAGSALHPVRLAAADSEMFVREAAAVSSRPLLLEQLHADVHRFAVSYLTAPPTAVVTEVRPVREAAFRVIRRQRHPAEDKDLVLLTGYLSGILAYAALDLGFAAEAETNARAALLAADLAGHHALRAWVRGTQSLIARWKGDYQTAYDLVEDGLRYAGEGTSAIRLRSGEAQCRAHMGDSPGTHGALNRAQDERESARSPDPVDGVYGFPQAKQSYYSGSSLIWLPGGKNARIAALESETAIGLWGSGPACQRSNADEALAHVYLATARLHLGHLDGVLDAIGPVLALPVQERVSWQSKRLGELVAWMMDDERYCTSGTAERICGEIEAFRLSIRNPDRI